jgi:DNA processing protein
MAPRHDGPPQLPEEAFAAALAAADQVGPATLRRLLAEEQPSIAWRRSSYRGDVEKIWRRHEEQSIGVHLTDSDEYPDRLHGDPEGPAVLFSLGDLSVVNQHPTVALVGTRSPTRYGIGVAAQLGAELSAAGVSVVSGLALGIDAAAHEGACAAGAPPVAVVAGGLDAPYPPRNVRLWDRVASTGVIVSESPAGVRTEKWRFPVRNRLLASLSDLVVVIESRYHGGSMHTVDAAIARGIPVGAVPGSVRSPTSEGTNRLLSDGCIPICGTADILMALSLHGAPDLPLPAPPHAGSTDMDGPDRAVYELLSFDPVPLDQLARESGLDLPALCGALERLAGAGAARDIGGWWERM